MREQIDFLHGERAAREKKARVLRLVKVGSILILLTYCLVVAAFFSYSFFLTTQAKSVNRQAEAKKAQIEALKDVESLQIILKQRLSSLEKYFAGQKGVDLPRLLDYFNQTTYALNLTELSLSTNGAVTLSGEAANPLVFGEFLEIINNESSGELFSQITLSSLDRKEDGSYSFSMALQAK
ncbi:hypothetical protein FJZ41_00800 [Candidatus Shapirobacteria bacterium]|nr:hypothetical protein [Candidatus Shapirobacteria bacterium]